MGTFKRIHRIIRAEMNDGLNNPEKEISTQIRQMEATMLKLRQSIIQLSSAKKRTQDSYNFHIQEIKKWGKRVRLALSAKDDYLAKEALLRKQFSQESVAKLNNQIELDRSAIIIADLQQKLIALEIKVADYKMLQARSNTTKAQRQLQEIFGGIDTSTAMGAFERMEDKAIQIEQKSQSVAELAGMGLEEQFAELVNFSGVDDELAAMKEQLINRATNYETIDGNSTAIDAELEELRAQLNED